MAKPRRLLLILMTAFAIGGCVRGRSHVEPEVERHLHPGPVSEATTARPGPPSVPASRDSLWYRARSTWAVQDVLVSRTTPMGGTPNRITVHHSDFPGDTDPDTPEILRRIDAAHRRSIGRQGLPGACIAYHFLIAPDGTVYEGRPLAYQGAHAGGEHNALNIGICLLGNFQIHQVPDAQARRLAEVLDRLRDTYRIPRSRVYGHRDFNPPGVDHTDCPGVFLYRLVKAYRSGP